MSDRSFEPARDTVGAMGPGVSPSSRAVVTYGLGFVCGAILFFLSFAAVFNGMWPLLILFVLCYAAAGALGVGAGGVVPAHLAIVLIVPAVPWLLWLFPASVLEAGLLRALLWPGLTAIMWGLAWLAGKAAAAVKSRSQ